MGTMLMFCRKEVGRTKQPQHTLPSSRLEPAPSFYDTSTEDPMTLSTFPNTKTSKAQDTAYHGFDDHSTTSVGGLRGYGNSDWLMNPSLGVANIPYSYHGLRSPQEELCNLSTAQAPYLQSAPQQMMRQEENNDNNSMFFLQEKREVE